MRYSASEKFEIIELVEQSSLSIRRTLAPIGIPRSTFYDWYSRYQEGGIENFRPGPLVFPGSAHLVTVLALRLVIPSIAMLLQVPQGLAPLHSRFMIGSTAVRPACHRVAHDILHKMISPEGGASLRRRAVPEARTAGLACVCPAHLSRAPSRASPDPVESI